MGMHIYEGFKRRLDFGFTPALSTVYVVYLAVALIWRVGKSRKYRQIKCMPLRL